MNSFGRKLVFTIFGTSHSVAIGGVLDGFPSGIFIDTNLIQETLDKRNPNLFGTTQRKEIDEIQWLTNFNNGHSTGASIAFLLRNKDANPNDYHFDITPRPGHADFSQISKYGKYADISGGGQASGRMTAPLVIAGALARFIIPEISISAEIIEIGGKKEYSQILEQAYQQGDSLGGIVQITATNIPAGLGEPFFDSVESLVSHLFFSIPGVKGIEFGAGFNSAKMLGSEFNDTFSDKFGKTSTNNAGGINGGITNGNDLIIRVAFRPPSSIGIEQKTINTETNQQTSIKIRGRHDSSYVPRTLPILESALALVLADFFLINKK
jgi:chorismate synthase